MLFCNWTSSTSNEFMEYDRFSLCSSQAVVKSQAYSLTNMSCIEIPGRDSGMSITVKTVWKKQLGRVSGPLVNPSIVSSSHISPPEGLTAGCGWFKAAVNVTHKVNPGVHAHPISEEKTFVVLFVIIFTFTFRAFSRHFYPQRLTIRTFVRRRWNNILLSVQ